MRQVLCAALFVMTAFAGAGLLRAAEPDARSIDEQYLAVANARTKAELSIRKARAFFEENENRYKSTAFALDQARQQTSQAIQRAIQEEQRRTEEMRNVALIEDLTQRSQQIEQDWQRFSQIDRPAIDGSYRGATNLISGVSQTFSYLNNLEPSWKDSKMEMAALERMYNAVTQRTEEIRAQADKAQADLQAARELWENVSKAATQPAQVTR